MKQLTKRQYKILKFIRKHQSASNQEIQEYLRNISRITIVRELNVLLQKKLIKQINKGRSIRYQEKIKNPALQYIDSNQYFKKNPDKRELVSEHFNFEIFEKLSAIFTSEELTELSELNSNYQNRVKKLSKTLLKKEFERLTIELSWKSSQIEGNTYSLIDTEILIKENQEAEGHKKEEAVMILNHKNALDYILNKKSDFKKLTLEKIRNIHTLIVENFDVQKNLRARQVGIIGTQYKPLDNQHQIRDAVIETIKIINKADDPFSKALLAILMISYVQPFEDGNKRTARLISNAILMAYNVCPLSYRSIDQADYKKALILFYEQNNLRAFKELFIEQFKFAIKNYF